MSARPLLSPGGTPASLTPQATGTAGLRPNRTEA
jgi:hypothetical protein